MPVWSPAKLALLASTVQALIFALLSMIYLFQVLPHEHDANAPSLNSKDRREAVMSFLEKREPVFEGR